MRAVVFSAVVFFASHSALSQRLEAQPGTRNRVELEIIADAAGGIDQNQRWLETLSQTGADGVRMTQATRGPARPGVEKIAGESGSTFKVTGVLANDRLILPNGRFGIRDTARIAEYITSIRADGAEVALSEKLAFGLTARQLVELHADLSRPIAESSVGQTPFTVLQSVEKAISTPMVVGPEALVALRGDYTLGDELKGLSHGTALAAALRPLGLVAAPRREQGQALEIHIVNSSSVEEFWPIGWPLERRISEAAPKMYQRIPVNVVNFTLAATLAAIEKKLEMPFLYDYNSLALKGVDLKSIRVNLESKSLSYQVILVRLISQARPRMDFEVRADEAGAPFIWIAAQQ